MLMPVAVRGPQFHLAELDKSDVLNKMLHALGHDWMEALAGSAGSIFFFKFFGRLRHGVGGGGGLMAHWKRDDHVLLQPRRHPRSFWPYFAAP